MKMLFPFLLGILATFIGEVGLAFRLAGTAESEAASEISSFERAFAQLGATIDTFVSGVQRPFAG
jgi:hypothetical protein